MISQAPFRLARIIIFGGLLTGAGIGLLIIIARLAAALKGGEGAPDVMESVTNLGVNTAAIAVLGFLLSRDLQAKEKDARISKREEELGRLLVGVTYQLPSIQLGLGRFLRLLYCQRAVQHVTASLIAISLENLF